MIVIHLFLCHPIRGFSVQGKTGRRAQKTNGNEGIRRQSTRARRIAPPIGHAPPISCDEKSRTVQRRASLQTFSLLAKRAVSTCSTARLTRLFIKTSRLRRPASVDRHLTTDNSGFSHSARVSAPMVKRTHRPINKIRRESMIGNYGCNDCEGDVSRCAGLAERAEYAGYEHSTQGTDNGRLTTDKLSCICENHLVKCRVALDVHYNIHIDHGLRLDSLREPLASVAHFWVHQVKQLADFHPHRLILEHSILDFRPSRSRRRRSLGSLFFSRPEFRSPGFS